MNNHSSRAVNAGILFLPSLLHKQLAVTGFGGIIVNIAFVFYNTYHYHVQ